MINVIQAIEQETKKEGYADLLTFTKILLKSYSPSEYIETRGQMEQKIKFALDYLYRDEK
jgi:hypothetical protein